MVPIRPSPLHSCLFLKHALVYWLLEYFEKYLRYFFVMRKAQMLVSLYIPQVLSFSLSPLGHNCFLQNQVKCCLRN